MSVTAEVADVSPAAKAAEAESAVATGWVDVENWGCAILGFSDGTRGVAYGSDTFLGGMQSRIEVMGSNFRLACNLSPHDLLEAYAPTPDVFGDEYVMEKASTSAGWNTFHPRRRLGLRPPGHVRGLRASRRHRPLRRFRRASSACRSPASSTPPTSPPPKAAA